MGTTRGQRLQSGKHRAGSSLRPPPFVYIRVHSWILSFPSLSVFIRVHLWFQTSCLSWLLRVSVVKSQGSEKMEVTISACILARNEEQRIEDALRSLQGWTDQILVIDNGSEDGTVAVARRY